MLDSLSTLSDEELLQWESGQKGFTSMYRMHSEALGQILNATCKEEYESKLAGARQEAADLVADAKRRADEVYAQRMAQAEADAKQTAAEAEARIAAERSEMLRSARGEVAHLAVLAASEVAGKRLDTDSDRALAEEFLAKVGEQA